jgi:hypothetical protein
LQKDASWFCLGFFSSKDWQYPIDVNLSFFSYFPQPLDVASFNKDLGSRIEVHMGEVKVHIMISQYKQYVEQREVKVHIMVLKYNLVVEQILMIDMDHMVGIMVVDIHYNHWYGNFVVSDLKVLKHYNYLIALIDHKLSFYKYYW